ncbi:MAG: hypothetical protein O3A14_17570, partial [Cyanobacteria bacterium]|nr:hypothetical protein [Cyanobacteriota bacterium]
MLVHQKQVLVERFQRKSDNLWVSQIYRAIGWSSRALGLVARSLTSTKIY